MGADPRRLPALYVFGNWLHLRDVLSDCGNRCLDVSVLAAGMVWLARRALVEGVIREIDGKQDPPVKHLAVVTMPPSDAMRR